MFLYPDDFHTFSSKTGFEIIPLIPYNIFMKTEDNIKFTYNGKTYTVGDKFKDICFDDENFRRAIATVMDEEYPLVTISGAGGCGKSVIFRILYEKYGKRCLCMAPTGVAAFNIAQHGIPCSTIHSALKLSTKDYFEPDSIIKDAYEILSKVDFLLIDEVSMVDCNMMDLILCHVRAVNKARPERRWLRVVLFGDVLQLPPVSPVAGDDYLSRKKGEGAKKLKEVWHKRYGEADIGFWFFSPYFRNTKRITIELKTVYRQSDGKFKAMLDTIRMADDEDEIRKVIRQFDSRVVSEDEHIRKWEGENRPVLHLCGRNDDAKTANDERAAALRDAGAEGHDYNSWVIREDNNLIFDEYAKDLEKLFKTHFPILAKEQTLYLGQQVMCLCNDGGKRFQNGTLGKITGFKKDPPSDWDSKRKYIPLPIVQPYDGRPPFVVPYHEFDCKSPYVGRNRKTGKTFIYFKKTFTVFSLACKSAYAVTFHKSQGLTLDAVYIDTYNKDRENGRKSYIPASGIYLGLSRSRTFEGVALSDYLKPGQVHINRWAKYFFHPDRDRVFPLDSTFEPDYTIDAEENRKKAESFVKSDKVHNRKIWDELTQKNDEKIEYASAADIEEEEVEENVSAMPDDRTQSFYGRLHETSDEKSEDDEVIKAEESTVIRFLSDNDKTPEAEDSSHVNSQTGEKEALNLYFPYVERPLKTGDKTEKRLPGKPVDPEKKTWDERNSFLHKKLARFGRKHGALYDE